jgi:hypothetical protein
MGIELRRALVPLDAESSKFAQLLYTAFLRYHNPQLVFDAAVVNYREGLAVKSLGIHAHDSFVPLDAAVRSFGGMFAGERTNEVEPWEINYGGTMLDDLQHGVPLFKVEENKKSGLYLAFMPHGAVTIGGIAPGYPVDNLEQLDMIVLQMAKRLIPYVH